MISPVRIRLGTNEMYVCTLLGTLCQSRQRLSARGSLGAKLGAQLSSHAAHLTGAPTSSALSLPLPHMPPLHTTPYTLGDRSYIREKVITTYETLFTTNALTPSDWAEFFFLKPNTEWLQAHLSTLTAPQLAHARPATRTLFSRCLDSMEPAAEAASRANAMETMAALVLGSGGRRSFYETDLLDALCGVDAADAHFGRLAVSVSALLSGGGAATAERGASVGGGKGGNDGIVNGRVAAATQLALRHGAARLLLAIVASAENLSANLLVELLLPAGRGEPPLVPPH